MSPAKQLFSVFQGRAPGPGRRVRGRRAGCRVPGVRCSLLAAGCRRRRLRRLARGERLTRGNPGVPPPPHSYGDPRRFLVHDGEPLDGDGAHCLLPAPLPGPARCGRRAGLCRKDLPPLPTQVQGVCPECPHQRLQHGEDPGAPGGVPWHHLPSVGRGGPGEAAAAVALLHPPDRRAGVCGGRCRGRAAGGGQGGAPPDQPGLGQPGGAGAGVGQQAGPARGAQCG